MNRHIIRASNAKERIKSSLRQLRGTSGPDLIGGFASDETSVRAADANRAYRRDRWLQITCCVVYKRACLMKARILRRSN